MRQVDTLASAIGQVMLEHPYNHAQAIAEYVRQHYIPRHAPTAPDVTQGVRECLEKVLAVAERLHKRLYEHSGAMNATQLMERDGNRKLFQQARASLEGGT